MSQTPASPTPLPEGLRFGPVYLRIRRLSRVLPFYRDLLGLVPVADPGETGTPRSSGQDDGAGPVRQHPDPAGANPAGSGTLTAQPTAGTTVCLAAAAGGPPLICLEESPTAPPRPPRTTGLYHVALLYPSRAALARAFLRLVQGGWRFQGFADHGVSEAIYLADPEGNGLELYADRPRAKWPRRDDGAVVMYTAALDLDDLIAAAGGNGAPALAGGTQPPPGGTQPPPDPAGVPGEPPAAAARTAPGSEAGAGGPVVGHVHLQVSRLATAERFYCGMLGFEVTQRDFPGALFVAAGGYHHHLGLNVWAGEGAPPPPPGAAGLTGFTLVLPEEGDLAAVLERVQEAGLRTTPSPGGWAVVDPDGIPVYLTV